MKKLYKLFVLVVILSLANYAISQQISISGKVRNNEGTILSGITIALQIGPNQTEVQTDGLGNYAFSCNAGHFDQLRVRNNMVKSFPKVPKVLEYVVLQNFSVAHDTIVDIQLHKFPSLHGKVYKADSVTTLDSIYILSKMWNFGSEQPPWDWDTTTIAGNYEIFLDSGNIKLWLTPLSLKDSLINFDFTMNLKHDSLHNIYFPKPTVLSGKIFDNDGIPIKNIGVAIEKGPDQILHYTDIDGNYSFVLSPEQYRIRVRNQGANINKIPKVLEQSINDTLNVFSSRVYNITLPKYPHVTGQVFDTAHNPIEGIRIMAKLWIGAEQPPWDWDTTDFQGSYSLYLGKQNNKFWITVPDSLESYADFDFTANLNNDTTININLIAAATIKGNVYTYDSLPVANITVAFQKDATQKEVITDVNGYYKIKLAPDTLTELRVRNMMMTIPKIPKTLEQVIERPFIVDSSITKNIYLPKYPKVYGKIYNSDGDSIQNVYIEGEYWIGAQQPPKDNCTSDVNGFYTLYLGQGQNKIKVTPQGTIYGAFDFMQLLDTSDLHKDIIIPNQALKLTRIQPSVVSQNEGGMVEISGVNSDFVTGEVTLLLGDSVLIDSLKVISPITLNAWINIKPNAPIGTRDIKAISQGTNIIGSQLFTITKKCESVIHLDNNHKAISTIEIADGTGTIFKIDSGTIVTFPGANDSIISYVSPMILHNSINPQNALFLQVQRAFAPIGTTFSPNATLTFNYQNQDVIGVSENEIRVFKFDDLTGQVIMEYTVIYRDTAANIISVAIPGFSMYRLADNKTVSTNEIQPPKIFCSPNPFRSNTYISFSISNTTDDKIIIEVYDIKGKKVKTLTNSTFKPGNYKVEWSGRDDNQNLLPSGNYFIKMNIDNRQSSCKVVYLR